MWSVRVPHKVYEKVKRSVRKIGKASIRRNILSVLFYYILLNEVLIRKFTVGLNPAKKVSYEKCYK